MASKQEQHQKQPGLLKSFIAGGCGGVALVFVGHPLDTVKVIVQSQNMSFSGALKTVYQKGGVRGFYAGMGAPITGVTPMYALCFFGYGVGKNIFCDDDAFEKLKMTQIGLAGTVSALFTTPILTPGERLKVVLQIQNVQQGGKKYNGPTELAKDLWKAGGIRSLYRGSMLTFLRDGSGSFAYFSSYEYIKAKLTEPGQSGPGIGGTILAGGTAGILNWLVALPFDTIKTRVQSSTDLSYGSLRALRDVLAESGAAGLYRGLAPVLLRAFPANAATFLAYEGSLKLMNYLFP